MHKLKPTLVLLMLSTRRLRHLRRVTVSNCFQKQLFANRVFLPTRRQGKLHFLNGPSRKVVLRHTPAGRWMTLYQMSLAKCDAI